LKINSKAAVFITAFFLLMCLKVPMVYGAADELDITIRELSDYLNRRIPQGSKVVFLNVKSDYPDFSNYILDSLQENGVNDGVFTVVDRQQLDVIRSELNFQKSGEVSDASAQEIGKMLGAQTIVSGSVTEVGSEYRIQVRAISVQTAAVQGLFSKNVNGKGGLVTQLTTASAAAAAKEAKRQEDERKKQIDANKRKQQTDYFLKTSGFSIGGWFGLMFNNDISKFCGGGDIELRLHNFFGLQSGVQIFHDVDSQSSEQIATQSILQIPVLIRLYIPSLLDNLGSLSIYGGLGINQFPFSGSDATILSPSKLSYIVGGDYGMDILNLRVTLGFQFNRDLAETEYKYKENIFNYVGQRSVLTFGVRYFLPFRRK